MPASAVNLRGHLEVGEVITATDTPWGKTQEEGVEVQVAVQSVELYSSQSTMMEDAGITRTGLSFVVRMIDSSLTTLRRLFGMPASALTGDLEAATPTAEVLSFNEGEIGSETKAIYSEGPGPESTRRFDMPECKLTSIGRLVQSKTNYMLPEATWAILNPSAGGYALRITDAP